MKLVRFRYSGDESYGVQTSKDELLDLPLLSKILNHPLASRLDELVQKGKSEIQQLERLVQSSNGEERRRATKRRSDVRFLAPIALPPKIVCLGLNYRDHAAEQNAPLPIEPIIFMKPRTAIIGPDDPIIKPPFVKQLDYEAELAVIIGEKGKDVSVDNAKEHVFGYTCFNDVSARDIQFKDKQWTRGKSFDTFAPMGPCITTVDQAGDVENLRIGTTVNAEVRQDSSTRNMIFNVFQVVHELSRVMTLEPCDVIATGTPAGVAFAMKPQAKFLAHGDVVEITIENIGTLVNRVTSI